MYFICMAMAGSVNGWGNSAATYTALGYDVFIIDYRGYGKSGGHIESEAQLNTDMQTAYNFMAKQYLGKPIIIAGYSIGTGPASVLAAHNNIKALILQAPYYSLSELAGTKVPLIPNFIKRYTFKTFATLPKVTVPVYLFHGTDDVLIPVSNSQRLVKICANATLIPLKGTGHNGINQNEEYKAALQAILN